MAEDHSKPLAYQCYRNPSERRGDYCLMAKKSSLIALPPRLRWGRLRRGSLQPMMASCDISARSLTNSLPETPNEPLPVPHGSLSSVSQFSSLSLSPFSARSVIAVLLHHQDSSLSIQQLTADGTSSLSTPRDRQRPPRSGTSLPDIGTGAVFRSQFTGRGYLREIDEK